MTRTMAAGQKLYLAVDVKSTIVGIMFLINAVAKELNNEITQSINAPNLIVNNEFYRFFLFKTLVNQEAIGMLCSCSNVESLHSISTPKTLLL